LSKGIMLAVYHNPLCTLILGLWRLNQCSTL
jgi:hypothetical protein